MTRFTAASFNTKNLIGPEREFYRLQSYTPEEFAWKADWLADQVLSLNADIIGFQEVFDENPLRQVIAEADRRGEAANTALIPDTSKRFHRKAVFEPRAYTPYSAAALAFARNANDVAAPGKRRPGIALLSRLGFAETPEVIQVLDQPLDIPMACLGGEEEAGYYTLRRLSRPILKARIEAGGQVISVFNCHLKSKHGEFITPQGARCPPETVLTAYDPAGRALGSLRAALRRMAEAWVLRLAVLEELDQGYPVIVLGDFNDAEHAVSTEIISGETPLHDYTWLLRHDAEEPGDRYTEAEDAQIREAVDRVRLRSAEELLARKPRRGAVRTTAFGGVQESVDQIFLSRHFDPEWQGAIGEMRYFSVFNDHLADGSHPEGPGSKLSSDHGQVMAHIALHEAG